MNTIAHPVLSCEQARELETALFANDEAREWEAMQAAGAGIARQVPLDYAESGAFPRTARLLVLAGKGHNGGDALIAATGLLDRYPEAKADIVLVHGQRALRPLTARALRVLRERHAARTELLSLRHLPAELEYDLSLDGIYGFQFRPPLDAAAAEVLLWEASLTVRLRAAVDLPSGLDGPGAFRADFTYCTGSVKSPVLSNPGAGRPRFLDLGFFKRKIPLAGKLRDFVLHPSILDPLRALRPAHSDKRSFGHLFIVAGSRAYGGAALMSVLAALRSGVGLVTAFVPESLVPSFVARAPEAMWVAWPETPDGGLSLEGFHLLKERLPRATALMMGPGIAGERETHALIEGIVKTSALPMVLDADALQPAIVRAGKAPRILTPHAGEYLRAAGGLEIDTFSKETGATVVLKGPVTRIASAGLVTHSFLGGPVLARGGSGDILAGLTGGLLAQEPGNALLAAARGVAWQGRAGTLLARARGQVGVTTTELFDFLPAALRTRDGDE
jgi:NAD(P)H-hydrate epimerase